MDSVPLYYTSSSLLPPFAQLAEPAAEERRTTLETVQQQQEHLGTTRQSFNNSSYTLEPLQVARETFENPSSPSPLPLAVPSLLPRPRFDSNSYEAHSTYEGQEQLYSFGTPSYIGSWNSDYSNSSLGYSPPPPPHHSNNLRSTSFESLYRQAEIQAQQLSLEGKEEMVPLTGFEESLVTNGGVGMEGQAMEEQRGGGGAEREMALTMPSMPRRIGSQGGGGGTISNGSTTNGAGSGAGAGQRPYAYTRSSSGFGSFLNYANTPTERARPATPAYSATRSTVFDTQSGGGASNVSEQMPNTSAGTFVPPVNTASNPSSSSNTPSLAKLEIPSAPAVHLTGPTPETAKPRPKGRGTLELERVLGLWAAKTPTSSFPSLPPLSSNGPSSPLSSSAPSSNQPLFAQSIVSSEPESFDPSNSANTSTSAPHGGTSTSNTSFSSRNSGFPEFPAPNTSSGNSTMNSGTQSSGDSLAPPSFAPRRRRSKSDTDVMRVDSLGFPHSNLPVGPYVDPPPIITDRPTFTTNIAPPTPVDAPGGYNQQFAMNPTDSWRSPFPPPNPYSSAPSSDLSNNSQQHEFSSRSRSPHSSRFQRGGGPGYHEVALLDIPGDGGARNRRSRSQGAGHRSSKSDDFSHFLPTMQQSISQPTMSTSSNGLLLPPDSSQVQQHSPVPVVAPSPVLSHAGSPYQHPQSLPPPPPQAASPYSSHHSSPYPSQQEISPYPPQPQTHQSPYPPQLQGFPPPPQSAQPYHHQQQPDQGYLANQAALLASAALIAFNPTDPAHAAAAAAGYLPPGGYQQPSPYQQHPQFQQYGNYPVPNGLPPLPPHYQAYPSPRQPQSNVSHSPVPPPNQASPPSTSSGNAYLASNNRQHPAYVYHSPLGQLPSPPPTTKRQSVSPAASSSRGRPRRTAESKDEDASMQDANGDDEGEDDAEGENEEEEEDEEEGSPQPASKGKGKKGKATKAASNRGKRQVSEEGFSERSKTTQATIDAAKRRRNANAVAKFVCELCGETFTRRYNLRGHQRAHTGEKPYKCNYDGCDKAFARAHDCKRHELLHLGVRKYHCSPCKRDFVRLDALHRHHRSEVGQSCVKQLEAEGYVFDEKGAVTL